MGFRTVIVNTRCKLEHRLNFLIIRGETERRVYINEINTLIVQSTAVSLTASLLSELVKNNVKIIFCDEKCNPSSELLPYYGAYNTAKRVKIQAQWRNKTKDKVWKILIEQKIRSQSELLYKTGHTVESEMLNEYAADLTDGDRTNREGHAAKVYFNAILSHEVTRHSAGFINGCLNYGYAVLLSAINREIVASGYVTQLGIWHDNEFNEFNLGSDLMEPLRTVVDETALSVSDGDLNFRYKMANILNYEVIFADKKTTLDIAIRQYVKSVLAALEDNDISLIVFPKNVKVVV